MQLIKGDYAFKQDQPGDQAYLIESGQIEIFYTHENGETTHLAVLNEGEIFGEMALLDAEMRSASARAFSDCQLMVISKDQLLDKIDAADPTVRLVMKMLLSRLRKKNRSNTISNNKDTQPQKNNSEAIDKLKSEQQINEAYKKNEFVIYHQPIIDFSNNKIIGSEALIRWESPQKGLIAPGLFIDILENSSMIIPVGYWIIEECFRHSKLIQKNKLDGKFSISINISGRQFSNSQFVETLKKLVTQHSIDPSSYKLEVTERVLIEGGVAINILQQCRDIGFEISLDDFGTGFSSLQYLPQLPLGYLKIDRSFVMQILKNEKTKAVVNSIVLLAKNLNLKVIAEGIETKEEEQLLKKMGADYGQGYLYSKPIPLDSLLRLI